MSCASRHRPRFVLVAVLCTVASSFACVGVDPIVNPRLEQVTRAPEAQTSADRLLAQAAEAWHSIPKDPPRFLDQRMALLERARQAEDLPAARRRKLLADLAEACFLRALWIDDPAKTDEQLRLFERGKNYAYEALLLVPKFREAMSAKQPIAGRSVACIPLSFVEPLLLMASTWARAADLRGSFSILADRGRFTALAQRAYDLDPGCHYSGPRRFFGAYWSKLPGLLGGSMKKSRRFLEAAIRADPQFLENHVMLVENWAIAMGETERAKSELKLVLAKPLSANDPLWLEQMLAQRRARRLMKKLDARR